MTFFESFSRFAYIIQLETIFKAPRQLLPIFPAVVVYLTWEVPMLLGFPVALEHRLYSWYMWEWDKLGTPAAYLVLSWGRLLSGRPAIVE